jgi:sorting nexin-25
VYPLQVSRYNEEGTASGWMIFRRYSQFLSLHQDLKAKFSSIMQNYELPGKLMSGIMKGRGRFMESRRQALEKYLQKLLGHQEICKFPEFRRFICHAQIIKLLYGASPESEESPSKKSFIRSVFNSVDDTVDAMFQKMRKGRSNTIQQGPSNVFSHNPLSSMLSKSAEECDTTSSAEPIIDFFVELFEIKGLRRQAIVIFLQNLFGDTVERRVTETLKDSLSQEKIEALLKSMKDTYWPSGVWSTNQITRSEDQKIRSKFESSGKLIQLFPELFGGIVGRQSSRKGAIRLATVFQNPRLNQHLMYMILDQVLFMLFPK